MDKFERLRPLEKAVELVAKATPDAWAVGDKEYKGPHCNYVCIGAPWQDVAHVRGSHDAMVDTVAGVRYMRANAEAIVAAVNFIREHGSALIAELGQGVGAVAWMREGATTVMHNVRFDKPASGPWIPLYTSPAQPPKAELGQEVAPVSAPEGWALVPKQMALTPEALGLIETMCAGPDNEGIGGEGGEDRWVDGLLWVGETIGDDGEKYWGLNIACAECLDEGSLPIFEFDRPTSPAHTSEARDAVPVKVPAPRYIDCPCCSSQEDHLHQCMPYFAAMRQEGGNG